MKTFMKLVAIAFLASSFVSLMTSMALGSDEKIAADVYTALEKANDGYVYVIVVLEPVPMLPRERMTEQQEAVRQIQERVLARMSPGNFNPAYLYNNFAAMTGLVNAEGLENFETDPEVLAVGLDAPSVGHLDDSVPFIDADQVQNAGVTGQGITVAVLDSGIDTDHPDLSDNIAAGAWHSLDQGADQGPGAEDDNGHGTNVSGVITSAGAVASVGVAPDADILAVKVLEADGSGWLSDWTAGVDYVVSVINDYDNLCAINMSLGTFDLYSDCPCDDSTAGNQLAQASILAARNVGIITFASSGNAGSTTSMSSPACLSSAIAVAAVYDQDLGREPNSGTYQDAFGSGFGDCFDDPTNGDLITCFSNRSGCNDLAAPGSSITAPGMGGGTSNYTGTSQASPHCAGVVALMSQRADDLGMTLSPDDILQALRDTGHATDDPAGTTPNPIRIDAFDAVAALNQAPEAVCSGYSDNADENCCITVSVSDIDGGSYDPDGAEDIDTICIVTVDGSPVGCEETVQICGAGLHDVTLEITDISGLSDMCAASVEVIDVTPPDIDVELNRYVLWPPNHKMVDIQATVTVEDNCDPAPTFVLTSVSSNEPDNGHGDGNTDGDIQDAEIGMPDVSFQLRSERAGYGDGRFYTIVYTAMDESGNTTDFTAEVRVPHDHSGWAMASVGYLEDGSDFDYTMERFVLVIPSTEAEYEADGGGNPVLVREAFDASQLEVQEVYVGNTAGAVRPVRSELLDVDGNGMTDMAVYYPVAQVVRTKELSQSNLGMDGEIADDLRADGQIGLHYCLAGVDYLVNNIFALGEPVPLIDQTPPSPPEDFPKEETELLTKAKIPEASTITSVRPNPFNPSTTIGFYLKVAGPVSLRVYDTRGKLVQVLVNESLPSGFQDVHWDGLDRNGQAVAAGVYLARLNAGEVTVTQKMAVLK